MKKKRLVPILKPTDDSLLLSGKVAWVIGGTGGIGRAIIKEFLSAGCKVIVSGTSQDRLLKMKEEYNIEILRFTLRGADFTEAVRLAVNAYGKIDIFVNASGVHIERRDLDFLNISSTEYDEVMEVNLKANYFLCQSIAKYFIANKIKGHILLFSSHRALEPAWSPYKLSKIGTEGLIRGLAQKLIDFGIIVNGIGPGPTATPMLGYKEGDTIYSEDVPLKRMSMPEEIAIYAKLLCSDLGDTIVGQTIYMSGGAGLIQ